MLLREIVDMFVRADSGGIFTDENRADMDYMEAMVDKARAFAIYQQFSKTKRVSPDWTQVEILTYSALLQDNDDCRLFKYPAILMLDSLSNAFMYVGTIDGNCNYRQVNSRAEYASNNQHRYLKQNENTIRYFASTDQLEFYGNDFLEDVRMDSIFQNPRSITQYNKLKDKYPISLDLIPVMQTYLLKEMQMIYSKPIDTKSDSADTLSTQNKK